MVARLLAKSHLTRTPTLDDTKNRRRTRGGQGRDTDKWRDPQQVNPPWEDRDLVAG